MKSCFTPRAERALKSLELYDKNQPIGFSIINNLIVVVIWGFEGKERENKR